VKKNIILSLVLVVIVVGVSMWYVGDNVNKNSLKGIKIISPNGGEIWSKDQKVQIKWSAGEEIKSVNIRLAVSGSEDSQNFNATMASNISNTGSYEWIVQDLYAEVWGVKTLPLSDKYMVIIEDSEHNNVYDVSDGVFTIK